MDAPGTPDSVDAGAMRPADASPGGDSAAGEATGGRWSLRRWRMLVVCSSVAFVVSTAAAVVLGVHLHRVEAEQELRLQALDTARQLAVNFTTLDYRTFGENADAVRALAAGDFAREYTAARKALKKAVTTNKAVSKGEVLEAGIVSFDPDSARVLVVADGNVTNKWVEQSELKTYRLQLGLARIDTTWRVVDLQFVG